MKTNPSKARPAGFALVVTLSLMILLTVIAVGLLTLSSITMRSVGQGSSASIARANARLSLMLALGELQSAMGPDQSVSAPASAVVPGATRPHLTGTWQRPRNTADINQWKWTPATTGAPAYSAKAGRFNGWLVSSANPTDVDDLALARGTVPTGTEAVNLVGNTASPIKDSEDVATTVSVSKVKVGAKTQPGKFGWAVFDESIKAAVDLGDPNYTVAPGLEIASRTVPNRYRADILDPKLSSLKSPVNLISVETASIPGGTASRSEFRRRFHDFTTGSVGLLTNTANGGLKTDLTSLFEPASLPSGAFVAPNAVTPYPAGFSTANGAPKWTYLRDHYRKYKYTTIASSGETTYRVNDSKVKDLAVINAGNSTGVIASPDTERLLPVIAKFQLVFSLVSHHSLDVNDRRAFLTASGDPKGYQNYGVVHLAYDPVVTLYNPYDVSISLAKTRIRIWDPPVGFKLTKIDNRLGGVKVPFRDPQLDKDTDGFAGLARFQRDGQSEPLARRCFTLVLTDGTSEAAGNSLVLKPGEVKVFSPRVQNGWSWGWETAGGYAVKTFFDFAKGNDFGNRDARTGNAMGVEAVPGWVTHAGLQTDHLAQDNPRYQPSKYAFESSRNEGFVTLRMDDAVQIQARPLVTAGGASKQFQVDVLAGVNEGTSAVNVKDDTSNSGVQVDTLRSYRFNFNVTGSSKDPSAELSADPSNRTITREFLVNKIFQGPADIPGLKKPFAMMEMSARTTKESLTDSKPWLYNNFVVEGGEQNTATVGLTHQSYDLRLIEISSFKNFPDGIAIDPDTNHGYFGANGSIAEGSSFVPMLHVPVAPTASLGDLIPANLASGSQLPRVVHPFGNSRAHPLVSSNKVIEGNLMDHSYLLNDALWDSYYFSTLTNYGPNGGLSGGVMPETLPIKDVLTGVLSGNKPALNNRLVAAKPNDPQALAAELATMNDQSRSRQLAKHVAVKGSFNVNSTSVDAWRAALSSLRDREINGLQASRTGVGAAAKVTLAKAPYPNTDTTPFVRVGRPLAGSNPPSGMRWAGFRTLTDDQIKSLAKLIVEEIRVRGRMDSAPFFSLGEFVNRRLAGAGESHSLAGLLQTAIDRSDINAVATAVGNPHSKVLSEASISPIRKAGVKTPEVLNGQSAEGTPAMLTQGDLMAALAPIATVRGDTFRIRGYGESTAANGTTVVARAWCEAVVQRTPEFVDPSDVPETAIASLTSPVNMAFGRRFNIISFRWLNESEL